MLESLIALITDDLSGFVFWILGLKIASYWAKYNEYMSQ
jgi:hypothetical protein